MRFQALFFWDFVLRPGQQFERVAVRDMTKTELQAYLGNPVDSQTGARVRGSDHTNGRHCLHCIPNTGGRKILGGNKFVWKKFA